MELTARLAFARNTFGPVHDRPISGTTPVRGDLLGPLVRRAERVRPADRVVVVGVRSTEVVNLRQQELGGLDIGKAVESGHLVETTLRRALGGRSVVSKDVVHQRVV